MLFMLIRTALWFVAIIAVALAFYWLKDAGGGVSVTLNDRAYGPFTPIEFVGIVLFLGLLIWLLIKLFSFCIALVRFFSGDETALSRFWNRSRERRGFDALTNGMTALAEGDGKTALIKARKAERLLEKPGLTRLLIAQAAEASGETRLAKDYYKQLASDPTTSFVGVKGLLTQALRRDEKDKALKLANMAFELKPKEPEVLSTLFELQCEAGDWDGAKTTLAAAQRAKTITRDVANRREAVLMLASARAAEAAGDASIARVQAMTAHKKSPALIPAAVLTARQQNAIGAGRKAVKILRDAWRAAPHPDVATAYAALAPDETPRARRKRFREFLKINPTHAETRMLAAELALADEDWAGAREAMGDLAETAPTARALAIMAAAERGDGAAPEVVNGWLAKAVAAPRGPRWTCGNCGARHGEWAPTCERCDAFDTLDWREGDAADDPVDAATAMAPTQIAAELAPSEPEPTKVESEAKAIEPAPAPPEPPAAAEPDEKPATNGADPAPAQPRPSAPTPNPPKAQPPKPTLP